MDYEKKYKETIDKIRELQWRHRFSPVNDDIEELFSELTESEDEKIRKELIYHLGNFHPKSVLKTIYVKDAIAWLEKQKSIELCEDEKIRKELLDMFNVNGSWHGIDYKTIHNWLEKKRYSEFELENEYWRGYDDAKMHMEEKQGEQKPNKCMYSNDNYTDEDRRVLCDGCEENCELKQKPEWSEEDEKRLKSVIEECSFHKDRYKHEIEESAYYTLCERNICWLKSLKDRVLPQQKQEWSEEDLAMHELILRELRDNEKCQANYSRHFAKLINWFESLKDRVQLQSNQEWSEEDERNADSLLEMCSYAEKDFIEEINWLKSLKDRVLPQSKQEWSKNDAYYHGIISYCLDGVAVGKTDKENAINWFKSLRPHSREDLSDLDKTKIWDALNKTYAVDVRDALYNKIVSCSPQKSWNPSEEQMMCLDCAIKEYQSQGYQAKTLESLYEQLKAIGGE